MMVKIDSNIEAQRISERQFFNVFWEFFWSWHLCVTYENRNNRKFALQGISDLEANKISWIVDSARSVRLFSKPMRADYRDHKF